MKTLAAIQTFLDNQPLSSDIGWTPDMETQVNVAVDDGSPVEGKRNTYTDGINEWWSFRVPNNAATEPTYSDREQPWALEPHVEAIGSTGWDWRNRCSRWVGFDFDSITGHAAGIGVTDDELTRIRNAAADLPYVEVRRSTGGNGLHLYVYLDAIPTANHTEHASLARSVLEMMSTDAGFDFGSPIDVCGGNMWIWHRKLTAENQGLTRLKSAPRKLAESDLPANWRDNIEVVTRKRSTTTTTTTADLTDEQRADLETLSSSPCPPQYVPEHGCWRVHAEALTAIDPTYKTASPGHRPSEANSFMFANSDGSWGVKRYGNSSDDAWGGSYTTVCAHRADSILDGWENWARESQAWIDSVTARQPSLYAPIDITDGITAHPTLHTPVIDGLIRRGEVCNLNSASKIGKSWLVYTIALCVAYGRHLFDVFPTREGKVLIVDNELHRPTLFGRVKTVTTAMNLTLQPGRLDIIPLRGKLLDLHGIGTHIVSQIDTQQYSLIIVDAWYRALPTGKGGENDNALMTAAYNTVDHYAAQTEAAWMLIHHSAKGDQSQKSVVDVGAGAGAQARAADTHLILRPHEQDDHVVLQSVQRSFPPSEPLILKWEFPLWKPVDGLDPLALGSVKSRQLLARDESGRQVVLDLLASGPATNSKLRETTGISRDRMGKLLSQLLSAQLIVKRDDGRYTVYELPT